ADEGHDSYDSMVVPSQDKIKHRIIGAYRYDLKDIWLELCYSCVDKLNNIKDIEYGECCKHTFIYDNKYYLNNKDIIITDYKNWDKYNVKDKENFDSDNEYCTEYYSYSKVFL